MQADMRSSNEFRQTAGEAKTGSLKWTRADEEIGARWPNGDGEQVRVSVTG